MAATPATAPPTTAPAAPPTEQASPPATSPPPAPQPPTTTTTAKPNPKATTTTTTAPRSNGSQGSGSGSNSPKSSEGTVQTISSQGGTVAVRYLRDERVELVWARPNPGYDVSVRSDGGKYVLVRFSNGKHRSWVAAYYENGRPQKKVLEADDDRNDQYNPSSYQWNGYRWTSGD